MFGRRKKVEIDKVSMSNMNDQLDRLLSGQAIESGGNSEMEVFFRKVEDAINACNSQRQETLIEVNQLGQHIMKMDFVRDMIIRLNTQQKTVETVAATSEEMSASISDIADHMESNTDSANKSVQMNTDSSNKLNEAVDVINDAFKLTGQAKDKVSDVTDQALKIKDMVSIIEAVADQTSLLALNASIEAARAGEAGRGFAVVANEINKLSESTKESVKLIDDAVKNLDTSVSSSVDAIDKATSSFEQGIININSASEAVESGQEELANIIKGMDSINQQIEQQAQATLEVAENVSAINESTIRIHSNTTQVGQAFADIASEVNEIRNRLISTADQISDTETIDIAITDHLNWRWNIYNMLLGYDEIDSNEMGDHNTCRLGKWIKELDSKTYQTSINQINVPHKRLHDNAKKAVQAFNRHDMDTANVCMKAIDEDSEIVVSILTEMMAKTLNNKNSAQSSALFAWNQTLTVYNEEIDTQHKKLLSLGRELQNFKKSANKTKDNFLSIINELKNYTVYHFDAEEKIMARGGYPNLGSHKEIHKKFVSHVTSIDFNKFAFDDEDALDELIIFLSQWVLQHIRTEDFKYTSYLSDNGAY